MREDITWPTVWWWFRTAGYTNVLVLVGTIVLQAVVELRESLVVAVWVDAKVRYADAADGLFMRSGQRFF